MAAGVTGFRAAGGGNDACWRVAGAIAALEADGFAAGAAAVFVFGVFGAGVFGAAVVLGATLRAIGRALGRGTFDLVVGVLADTDDPMTSASIVAMAVERNAAARADEITAFPQRRITGAYVLTPVD